MGEQRVEIRLEVEPESDPIEGVVHGQHEIVRQFRGWVALMAAVEDARSTRHDGGDSARTSRGGTRDAHPR